VKYIYDSLLVYILYTRQSHAQSYVHRSVIMSQTSFGHISINSLSILTVLMAMESSWKDLSIDTSHVSRQSIMAEILGRSTGNHYGTVH